MTKKKWIGLGITVVLLVVYYFSLPSKLFEDPYATVVEDVRGNLLSASIAPDGQWRFPEEDSVSEKFANAIVAFEDKRFWNHPGVDILSLGRALRKNISAGKIVSGGSTITMQVMRLSRKGKSRTVFEKAIEIILATRLELRYSKNEILALYASHAPFGGNVVGLDAACWRYFGRGPQELSWGEASMLAVLPNAPSLIHLGKNRDALKVKRDRLLDKLKENGVIDAFTCELAKEEMIPDEPQPLPRYARHLVGRATVDGYAQQKIRTTIQLPIQINVERIIQDHHKRLKGNQVYNAAAIVLDVSSGDVLAYAGNTIVNERNGNFGDDVDVISSPRSTGSILKPFLFAAMLDEGKMLPKTLIPDIPTIISGFAPNNFSKQFDGAVPADKALIRSLNIPAVHMLQQYRYEKFHSLLTNMGMRTLNRPPDHYGLSMILGGAEGTLWDISGIYASMARALNNFDDHPGKARYDPKDFHGPHYRLDEKSSGKNIPDLEETSLLSASSIFLTFEALKEVYRPGEETGWRYFTNSKKIAWKTGTSFGFRDGWAIGVTPDFVVGVWVGNASGEGRPGLTGTEAAAPVMFDIFSSLPEQPWFSRPEIEMEHILVCSKSGQRFTPQCEQPDSLWVTRAGLQSLPCAHHRKIFVTANKKYRINKNCADDKDMIASSWFTLPPVQEFYYRSKNLSYKSMPPFRPGCLAAGAPGMDLIYPKSGAKIFVPRELDGTPGSVVFELAHHIPGTSVYWHLDGEYIGTTRKTHNFPLHPPRGKHILTVVDASGEALERPFEIVSDR